MLQDLALTAASDPYDAATLLSEGEGPSFDDAKDKLAHPDYLQLAPQIPNIAEHLDHDVLSKIGTRVVAEYEIDKGSRSDWETRIEKAIKLATQVAETKTFPWPGASNVIYPLITVAALQFAARAAGAIMPGRDIVKGTVVGADDGVPAQVMTPQGPVPAVDPQSGQVLQWAVEPGAKQAKADRIGQHMSWQLTEEMPEWEDDMDKLLHILPIVGSCFKKTWWSKLLGRNCSHLVTVDKIVVNYWAKSLETTPRITEEVPLYPLEIIQNIRSGEYLDVELGRATDADNDDDAEHLFLEQHRRWDLDEDGYPEPYIVTVHKETSKVVRIVANWRPEAIELNYRNQVQRIPAKDFYIHYRFLPSLDGSFYGLGFGVLLDSLGATINTTINQMIDAGTAANTAGGFIGGGLNLGQPGSMKFTPFEFKSVVSTGAAIRDNVYQFQFQGPSPVLFQLLGLLLEAAKDITAVQDVLTGDTGTQGKNASPTTTFAMIEQGLKVFTSIYKRIHRSLKKELGLLKELNREYLPKQMYFRVMDVPQAIGMDDYAGDDFDVVPVSDPTQITDMQQLGRAQFLDSYRGDPLIDQVELRRRQLHAAKIPDADKLIVPPPNPMDSPEAKVALEEHTGNIMLTKAKIVQTMASATLAIAQAEAAEAGPQLEAYKAYLQKMEIELGFTADNAGSGEGSTGEVASGSDNPPSLPVPPGLPGAPQGSMGPMPDNGADSQSPAGGGSLYPPMGDGTVV